jgi:hypothetical protein
MKVYVAFRTDEDPPTKQASPSFTKLKEQMKEAGVGAEFTVVLYDIKPNVENLCKAIVDVTDLDAESATDFRVNEAGQLREVK